MLPLRWSATGQITRSGWLEILVRIAVGRCGKISSGKRGAGAADPRFDAGPCSAVAEALERLCREALVRLPGMAAEAPSADNVFRTQHVYAPRTSEAVRKHMAGCRALYALHADFRVPPAAGGGAASGGDAPFGERGGDAFEGAPCVMTMGGWLGFLLEVSASSERLDLGPARGGPSMQFTPALPRACIHRWASSRTRCSTSGRRGASS